MILGKIKKDEKKIKIVLDLLCVNCGKKVPGNLQASEKYCGTDAFKKELENFEKNYLCGNCRDKNRVAKIKE